MKHFLYYVLTVLIWGSTWIGIKLQLGSVEPMASVAYRFSLAALLLLGWCLLKKLPMRFSVMEHGFMALLGLLLFGFNYLFFYIAELYVTSGLAAVIFSTILLMNVINGALFLKAPIDKKVIIGVLCGLSGIILVFNSEIASFSFRDDGVIGVIYCLLATFLASLGNITSARNQKRGLPIVQTNGFGMGYGAIAMFVLLLVSGKPLSFEFSVVYMGSLFYLALFGSVIAFGCYLSLVGTIGADRAAYATLLFPLVALLISTLWEGYEWTVSAGVGVLLILIGNLWMLKKKSVFFHKRHRFRSLESSLKNEPKRV